MARNLLHRLPYRALACLQTRVAKGGDPERGDVPGWVMVTVMTAALVAALYGFASGALQGLLEDALTGILE